MRVFVRASGSSLPELETTILQNAQLLLRPPRDEDIEPLYRAALESVSEIRPWLACITSITRLMTLPCGSIMSPRPGMPIANTALPSSIEVIINY